MPRPRAEQPTYSLTLRNGRYYVQWWEDGSARRISCRTAVAPEARRFLAEFVAGRNAPVPPECPTIGDVLDGYQAERELRPVSKTLRYCVRLLKGVLGDLPADLLNKERVRHYITERRKRGVGGAVAERDKIVKPLADSTIRRELLTLRAALMWAHRENWISVVPRFDVPSESEARDRWLSRDEAATLLATPTQPHVRVFIALALYTAARAGAILELTWDRVDFERGAVDLGRGRSNKRRACVPMHPRLRPVLVEAYEIRTTRWVVSKGGRRLMSVEKGFKSTAERAGLSDVTPHTLRHTAATWMAQRGVSFERIAAYLGNTARMVEKVYVHHSPEHMEEASAALGD